MFRYKSLMFNNYKIGSNMFLATEQNTFYMFML